MGALLYLAETDLEQQIIQLATRTVLAASVALIILVILASVLKKRENLKLPLFILIALTMVGTTLVLLGSTVYLNQKSDSGGPVHWHADIEFWSCGAELDLRKPYGFLSNKIGTATYHEHNDKRIHLEGVVVKKSEDASLGKFMRVTGGSIQEGAVGIPLSKDQSDWFASGDQTDGDPQRPENFELATGNGDWITQEENGAVLNLKSGQYCDSGEFLPAELQVFVYSYDELSKTYSQRKLDNPAEHVLRDESVVPPGDCIIVEYDLPKDKTDKLCRQYGVRDQDRCTQFGVEDFSKEVCNIREVSAPDSIETDSGSSDEYMPNVEPFCQTDSAEGTSDPTLDSSSQLCATHPSPLSPEQQCREEAAFNPTEGITAECAKIMEAY